MIKQFFIAYFFFISLSSLLQGQAVNISCHSEKGLLLVQSLSPKDYDGVTWQKIERVPRRSILTDIW